MTYTNANGIGFYQTSGGTDCWVGGSGSTSPYMSSFVDKRPTGTDIVCEKVNVCVPALLNATQALGATA